MEAQIDEFTHWIVYRREVISLIEQTRKKLALLYQMDVDDRIKRQKKQAIFVNSRDGYAEIAERLSYQDGFKNWFAGELNNAKIGSVSAYNIHVPAFLAMIKALDYDFAGFFSMADEIGNMGKVDRDLCLSSWAKGTPKEDRPCPKIPPG